jgi:hypothetical protein
MGDVLRFISELKTLIDQHPTTNNQSNMQAQKAVALGPILKKLVPVCFVTGAAMELFMVKTGFCACAALFSGVWEPRSRHVAAGWLTHTTSWHLCTNRRDRDQERGRAAAAARGGAPGVLAGGGGHGARVFWSRRGVDESLDYQ